ncbi:endoribonuclease YBEY, chloroplastic-like isoform X1 [Dioscorea cayenensis subsp. rotundata]|uniref:Endoribonuclease YBEY, chloroplastic-like isoform X1 n=1 Tax=Dioscorea cayennensis subsp. rotundata TaxID=55577 RepID=A0AB40AN84_DIOCR|nr:endoribonuclease YBEY, chloroplastic-like isoform X1 [Dioscorea cayenensis subsp. rotundata]
MAKSVAGAAFLIASRPRLLYSLPSISSALSSTLPRTSPIPSTSPSPSLVPFPLFSSKTQWRCFRIPTLCSQSPGPFSGFFATLRGFRKLRRRPAVKKQPPQEKQVELKVNICIEEQMPDDPEILSIAEMLRLNVPMAMKIALDGLKDSEYKTRDTSINDVGKYEKIEISLLLCNDNFISKLNKEWRGEDCATDVLSMPQHIPELDIPILMLGDIIISVETAARKAEARGQILIDEIRMLMIHGLLHLLGFDDEISDEAEAEMEKEEELVLKSLGWKGKGLIKSARDVNVRQIQAGRSDGNAINETERAGSLRFYKPKFRYIFCNMDGTLLNSRSQISTENAEALREAISRGVNIVFATGKTRPAVISALKVVSLVGKGGVVSEVSPGIFLQGSLVYGRQGGEIFRRSLGQNICREAFLYSLEHEVPLIAFSQDRCLTLFEHPLVDSLHLDYHEPKAEVMPSVEHLLATADIQKLVFLDTVEGISSTLRPYFIKATEGWAGIVQAQPGMLEIVPAGISKGTGVKMLLDHLGIPAKEIMAIGDGENDVEMLQLASLAVALENGSDQAKAVADVIGESNNEHGVAKAIYQYAF